MKTRTIWTDNPYDIDYEDIINEYRATFDDDGTSDERIIESWYNINGDDLENIRISASYTDINDIYCFADLGLWDGRKTAWKELDGLDECFYSMTRGMCYDRWYIDGKDLKCDECHHDGTNHYTFRALKPTLTETQKYNFKEKLYSGITEKQIKYYTMPIGDIVEQVIY